VGAGTRDHHGRWIAALGFLQPRGQM